jgi:hypothetical protein
MREERKKGLESAHFLSSFPFCLPYLCEFLVNGTIEQLIAF